MKSKYVTVRDGPKIWFQLFGSKFEFPLTFGLGEKTAQYAAHTETVVCSSIRDMDPKWKACYA